MVGWPLAANRPWIRLETFWDTSADELGHGRRRLSADFLLARALLRSCPRRGVESTSCPSDSVSHAGI